MSNNWKTYKLGDIANFSYGKMPKKELLGKGIYPTYSGYKYQYKYSEYNCSKGDIIIVARGVGGTGDVKIVKENCFLTNLSIKIDLNQKNVENKFFYYNYFLNTLRYLDSGSAQSQITINDLNKLEIKLPPLQEQKSIAAILSTIDDKIENNLAINKTLEEMAMALYKHWFVDFGPFQDGEFVESELGRIPKGWEVKSVYDIANYVNGAAFKPSELVDEGKYVIKISELNGGITKNTGKSTKEVKQEQIINNGSVLFSWSATLDIFLWDKGEALLNQHIFNVLPNGSLSIETLYFLLKNIIAHFKAIAADRATTMGHIKLSHLKETFLAIPNEIHKQEFQKIIEPIFNQILENLTENQTLTQLRDTLLPKLISGEVRLKEFRE